MDTHAKTTQNLLAGESKVSFPTMLKSIQVGDKLRHEEQDLRVVTKTFREKDFGFLIEISLGSATLVSEQVINHEEMLWMIQAGNVLMMNGATRVVREKLFMQFGDQYSPTIYLMMP